MSNDYSFSLTTFSPNGKLVQIEHALNAVNIHGRPALGIKAKNGVVLATEKKPSNAALTESSSLSKVQAVADHIGCVFSGMPADYRVILARARKVAQTYFLTYGSLIPVRQLVQQVASVVQEYTQSGGVRPFGVSLLVCGIDDVHGPQLYQLDPSGAYIGWKATALGKDNLSAKTFLEKRYSEDIEIEDAVHTVLLTLKESFEGVMDENNIEIGIIRLPESEISMPPTFRTLTPQETKDYLVEVE